MATVRETSGSVLTDSAQRASEAASRLSDDAARQARLASDVSSGRSDYAWATDRPTPYASAPVSRKAARLVGEGRVATLTSVVTDEETGEVAPRVVANEDFSGGFQTSVTRSAEFGSRFGTDSARRESLASRTSTWAKRELGLTQTTTLVTKSGAYTVTTERGYNRPQRKVGRGRRAAGGVAGYVRRQAASERGQSGLAAGAAVAGGIAARRGVASTTLKAVSAGSGDEAVEEVEHAWQTAKTVKRTAKRAARAGKSVDKAARFAARHLKRGDLRSATVRAAKDAVKQRAIKLRNAYSVSRRIRSLREAGRVIRGQGVVTWARSVVGNFARQTAASTWLSATKALPVAAATLLACALCMALTMCASQQDTTVDGLTEVEQQVYSFFRSKELNNIQIAGIMGNMYAESGMDPAAIQSVRESERDQWTDAALLAIGDACGRAVGLPQWDGGRRTALIRFAQETGRDWRDAGVQLEYFWDHDEWQTNWTGGSGERYGSKAHFMEAETAEEACRQFYFGWERGGVDRMEVRVEAAKRYFDLFTKSYDTADYQNASDQQRAIVDACYAVPSPGAGLCAAWVWRVYDAAGLAYESGNACDLYSWYCHSSNRAELKVGMLVASPSIASAASGSAGWVYGHVGIYIGGGKVMSNASGVITIDDFDVFCSRYRSSTMPIRWGFPCDVETR